MDLTELRELRKKATQGKWTVKRITDPDGDGFLVLPEIGVFDDPSWWRLTNEKARDNMQFIAAIVNFFDLPSTQAMLEAGEGKQIAAPQEVKSGKAETAQFSSGNQTEGTPSTTRLERSEITGPAVAAPDPEELCGRLEQISDEALARYVLKNLTLFNRDANLFYLTGIFQEVRRTAAERRAEELKGLLMTSLNDQEMCVRMMQVTGGEETRKAAPAVLAKIATIREAAEK